MRHASSAFTDSVPWPSFALRGLGRGNGGAEIRLALDGVDDDARGVLKAGGGKRADAFRRDGVVSLQILLQVVGVADVLVVGLQAVGDAAEAALFLETFDQVGLERIARAFDFRLVRRGRPNFVELFVERLSRAPPRCGQAGR